MGRKPCCNKDEVTKGAWTSQEDRLLSDYIVTHGEGKWRSLPLKAGLKRCGKSCRLRWLNYLKPDIKRGNITLEEEDLIIELHKKFGNRWSLIAEQLPGRTDNEIKNYWNTSLKRKILNDGSKLELSPKNKKAQSRKRTTTPVESSSDIVIRAAKPSPCTEITLSGPTSEQNSEQDSSSSTNIWENLLEDLELDSVTKVHKNVFEIGSMETSTSIISNDSFEWNVEEIWKNEVDTPPFSENEGDWCGWLESFDVGSFSCFLDEDLWASDILIL